MVNVPSIYTPMHQEEIENEVPAHEEVMLKLLANMNFFNALLFVGQIIFVQENQPGVSSIDLNVWQKCDGSEITHPDSPLRTVGANQKFTPDLRNRLPRCALNTSSNPSGGSLTFAVGHNHGGSTGNNQTTPPRVLESDGNRRKNEEFHQHPISSDLSTLNIDFPEWVKGSAYMKIV